jgi:putative flavoprotein involved in K+ transport
VVVIGAGQSGLAAVRALLDHDLEPLVLEAGNRAAGSWPCYYDSLMAFSPAGFSSLRGMSFPGHSDHYPARDEVASYLERYAARLGVDIITRSRVVTVGRRGRGFVVITADGSQFLAAGVVAASGSFSSPHRPAFTGQEAFKGEVLHVADYRNPAAYAGQRVIVAGAGDSAAQVANELAPVAEVTLAARHPLRFMPQRIGGQDVHYWLHATGFDSLPAGWLDKIAGGSVITDSVGFRQTLAEGLLDVRPMFTGFDGDQVVWGHGERERADTVILATGYRPSLGYLRDLGALDASDAPLHVGGVSTSQLGLVYLGLEFQRSFSSNTLRGVSADADAVIAPLAARVRDAPRTIGLTTGSTWPAITESWPVMTTRQNAAPQDSPPAPAQPASPTVLARRQREQGGHTTKRVWHQPVVHPGASPLAVDNACLAQHLQVVADRRLGQAER